MPSQVVCLIFVERNITAKVLERFIKKVCFLSHFTVSYLAGGSSSVDALTPKTQKDILDSFRSGKANLLFTTDVAEEGTDVPDCSCVISFDLPKTARSYIQSHGRARQAGSHFRLQFILDVKLLFRLNLCRLRIACNFFSVEIYI
ncbi:unnamed protein product [Musa acuminata subsp. burmannicoides]|uniref:(wild Malaysian banana) hypothetical protein n=1 Tax=Musa acuminata subsp. malaccensis TaxID=214687 RepID=A0A804L162_MUSAM|nr:unnamed protein product [Musa acuminata subsp. malaccensis]